MYQNETVNGKRIKKREHYACILKMEVRGEFNHLEIFKIVNFMDLKERNDCDARSILIILLRHFILIYFMQLNFMKMFMYTLINRFDKIAQELDTVEEVSKIFAV